MASPTDMISEPFAVPTRGIPNTRVSVESAVTYSGSVEERVAVPPEMDKL